LSELGWRELCRHLVFDAPGLALRNLQPSFDAFPWQPDDKALVAWQSRQLAMVAGADAALPEFAQLPTGLIHQPWRAAPLELKGAGVELGTTYPGPIIDHRAGRERALKAYAKVRASEYAPASALHTGKSGYRCVINNTGGRYGRRETRSGTDARRDEQRY
jgi:hypothetical protein